MHLHSSIDFLRTIYFLCIKTKVKGSRTQWIAEFCLVSLVTTTKSHDFFNRVCENVLLRCIWEESQFEKEIEINFTFAKLPCYSKKHAFSIAVNSIFRPHLDIQINLFISEHYQGSQPSKAIQHQVQNVEKHFCRSQTDPRCKCKG